MLVLVVLFRMLVRLIMRILLVCRRTVVARMMLCMMSRLLKLLHSVSVGLRLWILGLCGTEFAGMHGGPSVIMVMCLVRRVRLFLV